MPSFRQSRSMVIILLFSLFSFSLIVGCGQNESTNAESENKAASKNKIAIKVGSESISMAEFNRRINQKLQRFKQNPRMQQQLKRLPKKKRKQQMKQIRGRLKQQLARQLETQLLLDYHIKKAGISVSDEEVQNKLDEIKQRQPKLKQMLKKQGKSLQSLKDRIREQMKIQKFVNQKVGTIEVTEKEARNYYKKNKKQFSKPERVKARHILITDTSSTGKSKIQSLKQKIEDGAQFSDVARKESQGPSAKRGGSLDYITRGEMVTPFSDAAFSLDVGEVSDPVKTRYGWHLIKVEDRKQATESSYESVSDTIVERVRNQKKKQKFRKILRQLKQQTEITNNISTRSARRPRGRPAPPQGKKQ